MPLVRALGAVDRKTFEGEFGLTSERLREGGRALLKAGGSLAETLAASSAGLTALTQASRPPERRGGRAVLVAQVRQERRFGRLPSVTTPRMRACATPSSPPTRSRPPRKRCSPRAPRRTRSKLSTKKWATSLRAGCACSAPPPSWPRLTPGSASWRPSPGLPPISAEALQEAQAALAQDDALRDELDTT